MARKTISDFRRATANRLRSNATTAEQKLWRALERIPLEGSHFRRQAPIGPYIADFLCPATKLVIEVDGEQHGFDAQLANDRQRTQWLEQEGYRCIRFWNQEIFDNLDGVLDTIYAALYGELHEATKRFRHDRYIRTKPREITPPRTSSAPPPPGEGEER